MAKKDIQSICCERLHQLDGIVKDGVMLKTEPYSADEILKQWQIGRLCHDQSSPATNSL